MIRSTNELEHHKGVEDFRITNEDGSNICIFEVKGKDRGIVKPDLLKFEANRDAAGKDQALFLYSHHPHLIKIHQTHHRDIILVLLRRQPSTDKQQPCIGMNAHLRKSTQYLADPLYSDWDEHLDILRAKFIVAFGPYVSSPISFSYGRTQ